MSVTTLTAIVEDDEAMREALCDLLQVVGLPSRGFGRADAFLDAWTPGAFACLVTDVRLPGLSGLELLRRVRQRDAALPVIVISSHADHAIRQRAHAEGALAVLTKPLGEDVFLRHLRTALSGS